MACADIYTGTAAYAPTVDVAQNTDYGVDWHDANVQSALNRLPNEVLAQLPLKSMYALANTLLRYEGYQAKIMGLAPFVDNSSAGLYVGTSKGNGSFDVKYVDAGDFGVWSLQPHAMPVRGDFNRDGREDVAMVGPDWWSTIPVALDNGDGTVEIKNEYSDFAFAAWNWITPVAGDYNGDGFTDIAAVGDSFHIPSGIPLALSNGDGTFNYVYNYLPQFQEWATNSGATPVGGDFNGDGFSDIALVGGWGWSTIPIAFSNSDGTFSVRNLPVDFIPDWATWQNVQPVAGDFNGDGLGDIALTGSPDFGSIPIALSNGDDTFTVKNEDVPDFARAAGTPDAVAVTGDYNRDGNTDIALVGMQGWTKTPVAFSQGDGKFAVSNKETNLWIDSAYGTLVAGSVWPWWRHGS